MWVLSPAIFYLLFFLPTMCSHPVSLGVLFWTLAGDSPCRRALPSLAPNHSMSISQPIMPWMFNLNLASFCRDQLCIWWCSTWILLLFAFVLFCFSFHGYGSFRQQALCMLSSQCLSHLTFPFILLLLFLSEATSLHIWINVTIPELCFLFPSSKYINPSCT